MISGFEDYAGPERQRLIASVHWQSAAKALADRCMALEQAIARALWFIDNNAPDRVRQELLEAK